MTPYPTFPGKLSEESAGVALQSSDKKGALADVVSECDLHIQGAPEGWDATACEALRDEALAFLAELA